jgi:hypothetical protein
LASVDVGDDLTSARGILSTFLEDHDLRLLLEKTKQGLEYA